VSVDAAASAALSHGGGPPSPLWWLGSAVVRGSPSGASSLTPTRDPDGGGTSSPAPHRGPFLGQCSILGFGVEHAGVVLSLSLLLREPTVGEDARGDPQCCWNTPTFACVEPSLTFAQKAFLRMRVGVLAGESLISFQGYLF
jgi:hypothetical protein